MTSAEPSLGFHHHFVPSTAPNRRTLLLLHGTGGDENDLLPLGRAIDARANLLSPRGKVLERGMPRFFRRTGEGVFDIPDLRQRADELAHFVAEAAREYKFDVDRVTALGFSNGANIAAALLLLHPHVLQSAILFRAMVPLDPERHPDLSGRSVFLAAGRHDPIVPAENTEQLARMLRNAAANVTLHWTDAGHQLTGPEVDTAEEWLRRLES